MALVYRPSNAQDLEALKKYCEDMFREYAAESNALRIERLPTVSAEPNPTEEGMIILADGVGFNPTGEGRGIYSYVNGAWIKLDN